MGKNRLEDLLGVKWYDGLLVNSSHLSHLDARVSILVSEACAALNDQPGLIDEDPAGRSRYQLIEIDGHLKKEDALEVTLNITRAFRAVSPGGDVILAIPNNLPRSGIPTTTLRARLPLESEGDYLVCIRQQLRNDLKIEATDESGEPMELVYPGLDVELVRIDDFKNRLTADLRDSVAVALISSIGGELTVDSDYIPPVARLEFVRSFDEALVGSLNALLSDLYRVISGLVESSRTAFSKEGVGADLMSRLTDYQILKAFLLSKQGILHHLNRLSPARFFFDIAYPLARWWVEYYQKQLKTVSSAGEQTPLKRLFDLGNRLMERSHEDLAAGTSFVLYESRDFIEGLNRELGVIA